MIDSIPHRIDRTGPRATGWLVSCLLHGSLTFAAILLVQRMQLAPQAEPFKWNVVMVASSPIAVPSAPQTSVPADQVKTAPTPVLQRPNLPAPAARPVAEPPQPRVETPAILPPDPVAPVVEKPTSITPVAPPPPIAELAPKPPVPSKPESVHQPAREQTPPPIPMAKTDQVMKQSDTVVSTPHDSTPAASAVPSAKFEPSPQHTSTPLAELTPPVHDDSGAAHSETQANQPPATVTGPQVVAIAPASQPKPAKIDYGWLSDLMARWIEDLDKRYPAMLRTEGIQGKVTLTALLHEDGVLSDVRVTKSSGNAMLDQVAVEDVRKGPPIALSRPLERPLMPVKFSIIYDLKTAR
ncbi:MAG: hypothetical protein EWM72_00572 [Nitrospira sp.]|nr:MAG: hypothetical protein EWM72_00572 [Nitrospira sp.]